MTAYPIASNAEAAATETVAARTAPEAQARTGAPVFLAVEPLPGRYATPAEAEAAWPALYTDGRFELAFLEGGWAVLVRYWRAAPAAPVARDAAGALKKPIGYARTPEEAQRLLGTPGELANEEAPQAFRTRAHAARKHKALLEDGVLTLFEREGMLRARVSFWRPIAARAAGLLPSERAAIAARLYAPLRPTITQASLNIGLFEKPAPENPDILLAEEEGDGRGFEE